MYFLFIFAHVAMVLILTIRILSREDLTGPARLAWFVTFASLPLVGSIVYCLFGEVYLAKPLIGRHKDALNSLSNVDSKLLTGSDDLTEKIEPQHRDAFKYSTSINEFSLTEGNEIELLTDSDDFSRKLVEDIDNAKESVCILYYIWLEDNTGKKISKAVQDAARRGVDCKILVDDYGSRDFLRSQEWADMKSSGANCHKTMPPEKGSRLGLFNRFDLRNHRKITVIDGVTAYCGSRNCADPEFRSKPKYAPWVDIMTRVKGPVVNQILALFALDWATTVPGAKFEDFSFKIQPQKEGVLAQFRGTGPLERRFSAAQSFAAAIHSARKELVITTPYFVPDSTILNALCKASLSGVDVSLTLPARNDSFVVSAASRSHYPLLLASGVRIYEYKPGLLHSKIMTIDGVFTIIGSSNLDLRSLDLNYENDLLIYDASTTEKIRARQESYLADSNPVDLEVVKKWSVARRIYYNAIATLGPIL